MDIYIQGELKNGISMTITISFILYSVEGLYLTCRHGHSMALIAINIHINARKEVIVTVNCKVTWRNSKVNINTHDCCDNK